MPPGTCAIGADDRGVDGSARPGFARGGAKVSCTTAKQGPPHLGDRLGRPGRQRVSAYPSPPKAAPSSEGAAPQDPAVSAHRRAHPGQARATVQRTPCKPAAGRRPPSGEHVEGRTWVTRAWSRGQPENRCGVSGSSRGVRGSRRGTNAERIVPAATSRPSIPRSGPPAPGGLPMYPDVVDLGPAPPRDCPVSPDDQPLVAPARPARRGPPRPSPIHPGQPPGERNVARRGVENRSLATRSPFPAVLQVLARSNVQPFQAADGDGHPRSRAPAAWRRRRPGRSAAARCVQKGRFRRHPGTRAARRP